MLVYYFLPFIVNNRYLLFQVSSGHNSVTVQNRTHVRMNFFAQNHSCYHFPKQCRFLLNHPVYVNILSVIVFFSLNFSFLQVFKCLIQIFDPFLDPIASFAVVDAYIFVLLACIDRCCRHGGNCTIGSQQMWDSRICCHGACSLMYRACSGLHLSQRCMSSRKVWIHCSWVVEISLELGSQWKI